MRNLAPLLLWSMLVLSTPGHAADFPVAQASQVFASALDFMAPRTLEETSIPQLAIWGLKGVSALDPALVAEQREGQLVLASGLRVIASRPAPAETTGAAWGRATADVFGSAWATSDSVRRGGLTGVLQSFFDEVFNHFDPYSRYVPPEAANQERDRRIGTAGIGLNVTRLAGSIVVKDVKGGGPAAEAGLTPGDRVTEVDGQSTVGRDAATVQGWIAGDDETVVSLVVRRRGIAPQEIEVTRAAVPPESVFVTRLGDLALIRVTMFSTDTDQRLSHEIDGLAALQPPRAARGVVLDLRGNRGGLLRQAVDASRPLLGRAVVATTEGRNPQASHAWQSDGPERLKGVPVIVLVDGRTASAAEVIAAALADQGRAVVVGSATLGKGLVQTIAQLPDGGELFVTWSRVLAPLGWPIQGLGVMPQVCTSLGEESLRNQLSSLERGQDLMEGAIARARHARAPLPAAQIVVLRQPCPAGEARDADLEAARWLVAHPAAYAAALLAPAELR